jgi:hypothetical protein
MASFPSCRRRNDDQNRSAKSIAAPLQPLWVPGANDPFAGCRVHFAKKNQEEAMKALMMIGFAAALAIAGCDGPYQKSGEKADAAHGTREHIGQGPGEAAGRAIDKSLEQASGEMAASADRLQEHAENVADAIDQRAGQMESQADQLRADAKRKAEAIKQAAKN